MKNQIALTQRWVQKTLIVMILLLISFSSFAQNPGGGGPGGPGGSHPSFFCNAHFFHHRDSIVNGVRFFNFRGSGAATYSWDFGDGSSSTQWNPSHTYADSGLYVVCLTITDTIHGGCTDTYCDSIHVFKPRPHCNSRFWARRDSVPNGVRFFTPRRGHGNPSATVTYSWDFGDGSGTSTLPNPVYAYADSGKYNVCLTVTITDVNGSCTGTFCDSINTKFPRHHRPGPRHHHHFKEAGENLETSDITEVSDVLVSVYPNPMVESSTIHIENTSGDVIFRLFNITGQVALTKQLGNGDFTINKENLQEGLYFYTIEDSNTSVAKGKLQVY